MKHLNLYEDFNWDFDDEEYDDSRHPGLIELDEELTKHIINGVPFPVPGNSKEGKVIIHINGEYDEEYQDILKKYNITPCNDYYDNYTNNVYYFITNRGVSFNEDSIGEEYVNRMYPNNKIIEIV